MNCILAVTFSFLLHWWESLMGIQKINNKGRSFVNVWWEASEDFAKQLFSLETVPMNSSFWRPARGLSSNPLADARVKSPGLAESHPAGRMETQHQWKTTEACEGSPRCYVPTPWKRFMEVCCRQLLCIKIHQESLAHARRALQKTMSKFVAFGGPKPNEECKCCDMRKTWELHPYRQVFSGDTFEHGASTPSRHLLVPSSTCGVELSATDTPKFVLHHLASSI